MNEPWETDNRWRRMRVSSALISEMLRGNAMPCETDAPSDLAIVGLYEVRTGPNGEFTFVVWSSTFEPLPMDDRGRLMDEIPFVKFEYRRVTE
jgi:hypothetical protein